MKEQRCIRLGTLNLMVISHTLSRQPKCSWRSRGSDVACSDDVIEPTVVLSTACVLQINDDDDDDDDDDNNDDRDATLRM